MPDLYALSAEDLTALKRLVAWWRGGGPGKSGRPTPTRRRTISDVLVGHGYITEEITAAVYDDSSSPKTIVFGKGTMKTYNEKQGATDTVEATGDEEDIFTIAAATTPAGKHVHWMQINGRKQLITEPCD